MIINLSPYEKDRIIPQSFGLTEMGRDLLAEDYMLKQITASLIYPEDSIGKKFWKLIYEEASKKFGTTNIPVNTFNKVWIVPEKAVVYENAKSGTAYIVESKLKVMLEQDYLSLQKHMSLQGGEADAAIPTRKFNDMHSIASQVVRQIVIPELTKEVNQNKNFTQLRQVYNSLILAIWYKKKIKDSILEQVYADKNKIAGVNIDDPQEKEKIYQKYLRAFKKGVFNYIKEDKMTNSFDSSLGGQAIVRKYFSGGMNLSELGETAGDVLEFRQDIPNSAMLSNDQAMEVETNLKVESYSKLSDSLQLAADQAMAKNTDVKLDEPGPIILRNLKGGETIQLFKMDTDPSDRSYIDPVFDQGYKYVMELNDEKRGYILCVLRNFNDPANSFYEITRIKIDESLQGMGIGRTLENWVARIAKENDKPLRNYKTYNAMQVTVLLEVMKSPKVFLRVKKNDRDVFDHNEPDNWVDLGRNPYSFLAVNYGPVEIRNENGQKEVLDINSEGIVDTINPEGVPKGSKVSIDEFNNVYIVGEHGQSRIGRIVRYGKGVQLKGDPNPIIESETGNSAQLAADQDRKEISRILIPLIKNLNMPVYLNSALTWNLSKEFLEYKHNPLDSSVFLDIRSIALVMPEKSNPPGSFYDRQFLREGHGLLLYSSDQAMTEKGDRVQMTKSEQAQLNDELARIVEENNIPQFEALNDPKISAAPTIDEKLAFIMMKYSGKYLERARALVALNRPLAAVIVFAANGPHTRKLYDLEADKDEINAQEILINGFIVYLKDQLDMLDSLRNKKGSEQYRLVLAEATKYAGGLFNGLLIRTHLNIQKIVELMATAVEEEHPGIDLKDIIKRSAALLPEELPGFISFVGEDFGEDEIYKISRHNQENKTRITSQNVFLGVPSKDNEAEIYMAKQEEENRKLDPTAVLKITEDEYKYLKNNVASQAMLVIKDKAMSSTGGIDLTTAHMNVETKDSTEEENDKGMGSWDGQGRIKFHLTFAMFKQFQNASGLMVGSITMLPLKSLSRFLGLDQPVR